tara:strand:+ start:5635 stop:6396 length:762 start_codon:yes stop_codon:yes gene_type:complete
MRSNNAIGLLQFNIFEFSLLAEVVAAEAGLPMGQMLHFAGSMHAFESHLADWKKTGKQELVAGSPMSEMPRDSSALEYITKLIVFEAEMRHASAELRDAKAEKWIERARQLFDPYWQQFAFVLLLAVARRNNDESLWLELRSLLRSEFAPFYPDRNRPVRVDNESEGGSVTGDLFSFDVAPKITQLFNPGLKRKVLALALAHERDTGKPISIEEFDAVQDELMGKIAARGLDLETAIGKSDFDEALKKVRSIT